MVILFYVIFQLLKNASQQNVEKEQRQWQIVLNEKLDQEKLLLFINFLFRHRI